MNVMKNWVKDNYDLQIDSLNLIDAHFGTEIYLLITPQKKYIVKSLPINAGNLENEGFITDFLLSRGISVARILPNKHGNYSVKTEHTQFHIQEFIDGETFAVGTAPEWVIEESARTLGKIHHALKDYKQLPRAFDADFFHKSAVENKINFLRTLPESDEVTQQIKYAEKALTFEIDTTKLTYSNSHGDYYVGQIIAKDRELTVIDWASACCMPICLEVIMSYKFAAQQCADGLQDYIKIYSQYFKLNDYDIAMMPYVFYRYLVLTNYTPPFADVPESYQAISKLINNLLDVFN
jgi:Putative homoserine kinase type II (protein kinase fold)